jgi:hypothetical protein
VNGRQSVTQVRLHFLSQVKPSQVKSGQVKLRVRDACACHSRDLELFMCISLAACAHVSLNAMAQRDKHDVYNGKWRTGWRSQYV